ncbi:DNA-binding protein, partial [Salmonella enterica subsp. enterica serovar Virchow]|nr:DNA-binding protein [Salmonella enterica subsp. enterica serovar Virchow]
MPTDQPLSLIEDAETGDRFLVFETAKGPRIDIRFEGETLWMTQAQMAQLFGRDRTVITKHIQNIIEEGELDEATCVQELHTSTGQPPQIYNLDMVISVGYRVSSKQATLFRRWATGVLVQYARTGFVIDSVRLKDSRDADRIAELRDIIRDIRSDEANVYRELKRICAMCQDYEPASKTSQTFFQQTQAKLIYAVVSQMPAEIVFERANHEAENMGLRTWPRDAPRKQDAGVLKNYLAESEIRELNRLTTILLDIFEDQAELGRLILMADAAALLENQLKGLGRVVLRGGGSVSADDARRRAESEYEKFDAARKALRQQEADNQIEELARQAKDLP